jgi:hypothetical protein
MTWRTWSMWNVEIWQFLAIMIMVCWSRSVRQFSDLWYLKFNFQQRRVADCWLTRLIKGPPYGFGRHKAVLLNEQIEMFMMVDLPILVIGQYNWYNKGNYIFSYFSNAAIASTKLAVLALYYHIFIIFKFCIMVLTRAVFMILWLMMMEILLGL